MVDKIKALCDERGISIRQLEVAAGLGNATIRRWDTSSPSVKNLEKVAKCLDVPITALLDDTEEDLLDADGQE